MFCGIYQYKTRSTEVQLRAQAKNLWLWGTFSYHRHILEFSSAILTVMMTNLTTSAEEDVRFGPQSSLGLFLLAHMLCWDVVNKTYKASLEKNL